LALLLLPRTPSRAPWVGMAALAVVLGGLAQMAVSIIAAQAFPLDLFPDHSVRSSFFDGVVQAYTPSIYELALGAGGVALAALVVVVALKLLPMLPLRFDGDADDAHSGGSSAPPVSAEHSGKGSLSHA
jgi:Ni/Fe-hydrogenase subunit HybB-like protein